MSLGQAGNLQSRTGTPVPTPGRKDPAPVILVPSAGSDGLLTQSYSEFIAAYAQRGDPAPVRRIGELQVCPFQVQAERMFGTDVSAKEVDRLEEHLRLSAAVLDAVAPLCARKARRMFDAGLFAAGPGGVTLCRTKEESRVAKRDARSRRIARQVRRLAAKVGINGESHAFNPQAPGPVTSPRHHVPGYAASAGNTTSKVMTTLAVGGSAAGEVVKGFSDLASTGPLFWHAITIDGVMLNKLTAVEQAQCKVLLNLAAAEKVLRSWMAGERPDPQLGLQALEFWANVLAWPECAAKMVATMRQYQAEHGRSTSGASSMAELNAKRNMADFDQAKTGWLRDVPGSIPLGTAAIGRAALYLLGDTAVLGAAGVFNIMAAPFDVSQGLDEFTWAKLTKQQFRWRFEQLAKLTDTAHQDPLHGMVLLTAMLYCARKEGIARVEQLIAISRVLNGLLRGSGGAMSLAATLFAVPALGKGAVVVGGLAAIAFAALMGFRQHRRAQEAHAQKEGERIGEAVKATRDFEAVCDSFLRGFEITRGKGKFVNGDVGYRGHKESTRGPGENEMLAWEIMAREVVDGFRDGQPLSFSMQMMLSLGLGVMDADQLENGVLAKLHAGDDAGAVDAVERMIRNLVAAPPARATEAIQPEVFKGVFEAAEANAQRLAAAGRAPDADVIAALMFNRRKDGGLGVDRPAFERSMNVLAQGFDKRGAKADVDGVYGRMLQFSRSLPPAQAESAAQRHLEAWTLAGDRAFEQPGWTHELGMSHHRIWQLLDGAARQPEGAWGEQILAALDARVAKRGEGIPPDADLPAVRERVKQVLLNDVRALQVAGMLAGLADRVAQELSVALAPTAATNIAPAHTSSRELPSARPKTVASVPQSIWPVESMMERQLAHWTVLGEELDGDLRSSWKRVETLLSGAVDVPASSWEGQLERHVANRFGGLPVAKQLKIIGILLDDIDLVARSVKMNRHQKHLVSELRGQWQEDRAALRELPKSDDSSTASG